MKFNEKQLESIGFKKYNKRYVYKDISGNVIEDYIFFKYCGKDLPIMDDISNLKALLFALYGENKELDLLSEKSKIELNKIKNYFGENDKTSFEHWCFSFIKKLTKPILLLTALLLIGCGSRKSTTNKTFEKSESKVEVKAESESVKSENENSNVKTEVSSTTDTQKNITSVTTTYKPIDATKPASVTEPNGNKIDLNNAIYETTETIDLSNVNEKVNKNIDSVGNKAKNKANTSKIDYKADKKDFKKSKPRVVERKQFNLVPYIILTVAIGMFLLWWYFGICRRKNNNLNK